MDFSTVTAAAIPEGNVVQIRNGSRVLWSRGALPAGYRTLSYIETTGEQYIDTGISAAAHPDGLKYHFTGCITGFLQTGGNNYLFGCLNTNCRSGNLSANTYANQLNLYVGNSSSAIYTAAMPEIGQDFELDITCSSVYPSEVSGQCNGTDFEKVAEPTACQMPNDSIYLLWCKGVSEASKPFCGKLYGFRMEDASGTPLRSFLPCCRTSDGAIGLYDAIGKQFYENIGNAAFTGGA